MAEALSSRDRLGPRAWDAARPGRRSSTYSLAQGGHGGLRDDLRFDGYEGYLVLGTYLASILLNVTPINQTFGAVLLGFQAVFSLSSPPAAILAISASQISADPAGLPLTTAQILFCSWGLHFLLNPREFRIAHAHPLILAIAPFYLFSLLLIPFKGQTWTPGGSLDLAILLGIAGATYVGGLRGRYRLGLMMALLGASPAVLGYWFYRLGIPFEGILDETLRRGAVSIGFGRSDWNTAGVNIAFAVCGLLALAASPEPGRRAAGRANRTLPVVGAVALILGVPAIVATMSRGGLLNFVVCILATIVGLLSLGMSTTGAASRKVTRSIAFLCVIGTLGGVAASMSDTGERIASIRAYSLAQEGLLMSREAVFEASVRIILNEPLLGETAENFVELPAYGRDFASHNVFLDAGRGSGVPGLLLYATFFFLPPILLWRHRSLEYSLPFLIAYLSILLTFLNLSVMNHKTFFLLWSLLIHASKVGSARRPGTRRV